MSAQRPDPVPSRHSPRCLGCRYSLAGLRGPACPECGRAFDPADPTTFAHGPGMLFELAAVSPPRLLCGGYAVFAALLTLTLTAPDGQCSEDCVFPFLFFALMTILVWGVPFAIHLIGRLGLAVTGQYQPRWRWRYVAAPLAFAVFYGSVTTGALWDARWWLASGSFARLAARPPAEVRPGWVGGFRVVKVEPRADGTLWLTLGFPDLYSDWPAKLVYSPGRDPGTYPISKDVGGGWWVLVDPT